MNRDEILDELASQMAPLRDFSGPTFELLEDYLAIGDARLSIFAGHEMWAVVFELVAWERSDEFKTLVHVFGVPFGEKNAGWADFERELFAVPDNWNRDAQNNPDGYPREDIAVLYRGKRHDLKLSDEDLARCRIELSVRERSTDCLCHVQLMRYLCEAWNHPFFLSEDALRDVLNGLAPTISTEYDEETGDLWFLLENSATKWDAPPLPSFQLELLLQTRNWRHPCVGGLEENEAQTKIREAMAPVADLIATRDLAAWHAQNPASFNSDWRVFADYEAKEEREWQRQIEEETEKFRAWLAELSPEKRAAILPILAEKIATLPPRIDFGRYDFIRYEGREIRIFAELRSEIEALLRQTPPN